MPQSLISFKESLKIISKSRSGDAEVNDRYGRIQEITDLYSSFQEKIKNNFMLKRYVMVNGPRTILSGERARDGVGPHEDLLLLL